LKAILFHDPFHTPSTDGEAGLAELLSNDVDRGIGVEKAVTNDLSFDLISPNRVGLGSAFLVLEAQGSLLLKLLVQLIISLSREPMLLSGLHGSKSFAFSLDEHKQPRSDRVVGRDDEVAGGTDDAAL
jgi:hypothetical protein